MTSLPQPFNTAPRRVHRKYREATAPPAPPVVHQILAVMPTGHGWDEFNVILDQPPIAVDVAESALEVLVDGMWVPASGAIVGNPVLMLFPQEVISATQWRVPNHNVWHFEDDQPLGEPLSGSIE